MMRNEQLTSGQIMSLRSVVQRIVDMVKSRGIAWAEETLKDDRSFISFLMSLYFLTCYFKGIRRVVVYGTHGVSIRRTKKAGFDVLAVVDEKDEGKMLGGMRVLPVEFIKLFKPEALLVSPYKTTAYIEEYIGEGTVVAEAFGTLKKFLSRTKQMLIWKPDSRGS